MADEAKVAAAIPIIARLGEILSMTDEDYKKLKSEDAPIFWTDLFGWPRFDDRNLIASTLTLRAAYKKYGAWWDLYPSADVALSFLGGKASCIFCKRINAKGGWFMLTMDAMLRHGSTKQHITVLATQNASLARSRQMTLHALDPSVAPHVVPDGEDDGPMLVIGKLTSGGAGAKPIPPYSLSALWDHDVMTLMRDMRKGMPQGKAVVETWLPRLCERVEARIKIMVNNVSVLAFGIDGGNCKLVQSRKVIVVTGLNPLLSTDVLLEVVILDEHEVAIVQADIIEKIAKKYGIYPSKIKFLVADGASVNEATVNVLHGRYDEVKKRREVTSDSVLRDELAVRMREVKGWASLEYVRCLPHALNRFLTSFIEEWDERFGMSSFLKKLRAFINAGGGAGRKLLLIETALTLSGVDFSDTRWTGFIEAVRYICSAQSPAELKRARARFEELAAKGSTEAAEILLHEDEQLLHWNAFYAFIEGITESELDAAASRAGADITTCSPKKTRKELLSYLADLNNFAAFQMLNVLLGGHTGDDKASVSTIYALTQGQADWALKFATADGGVRATAVAKVEVLRATLSSLSEKPARSAYLDQLRLILDQQIEYNISVARSCNEPLLTRDVAEFCEEDVAFFREQQEVNISGALKVVSSVMKASARTMRKAASFDKLDAALEELKTSSHFDCSKLPPHLPSSHDDASNYLGLSRLSNGGIDMGTLAVMRHGWAEHRKTYEETTWARDSEAAVGGAGSAAAAPRKPPTPYEVCTYWNDIARSPESEEARLFGMHALRMSVRPLSSASCERVFSYLTDMDDAQRRNMGKELLRMLLFLRGNYGIVAMLAAEKAAKVRSSRSALQEAAGAEQKAESKKRLAAAIEGAAADAKKRRFNLN